MEPVSSTRQAPGSTPAIRDEAGPGRRRRTLRGHAQLARQQVLGLVEGVLGDEQHVVDAAVQLRDGLGHRDARRDALGVGRGLLGLDEAAEAPRALHRRRALGLDADDPALPSPLAEPRADADDEGAVADGDVRVRDRRQLAAVGGVGELERERSGTRGDRHVLAVDEEGVARARRRERLGCRACLVEVAPDEAEVRAEAADAGRLRRVDVGVAEHDGRDAGLARRVRDALAEVAARGDDDGAIRP